MKNNVIERVACYVRVSSDKQAEEGYSIDEQIERLTAYCKAMDWRIVKIYTDAGYSGGNMNRPALTDLIAAAQSRLIDAVVVYKLDRLSRSQRDTLTIIEGFLEHGVDFVSMTENFDTSTPFGKATIGILSVFAQLEREQIKERCSLGRAGRAKEGKYRGGGYVPIGYEYKDGSLIVNPSEAMQIRELHELYQKGESFRTIASDFRRKGIHAQVRHMGSLPHFSCVTESALLRIHHPQGRGLQGRARADYQRGLFRAFAGCPQGATHRHIAPFRAVFAWGATVLRSVWCKVRNKPRRRFFDLSVLLLPFPEEDFATYGERPELQEQELEKGRA